MRDIEDHIRILGRGLKRALAIFVPAGVIVYCIIAFWWFLYVFCAIAGVFIIYTLGTWDM